MILFAVLICSVSLAQKNPLKQGELLLHKGYPVHLKLAGTSPCRDSQLIQHLSDSLKKEGFELIDSLHARNKAKDFFEKTFSYSHRHNYEKTVDEVKAYTESQFNTAKLFQELAIYKYSCVDTLHNYTISLYMFPRAKDAISQSFMLPFDSPYPISSIILSLIKRD